MAQQVEIVRYRKDGEYYDIQIALNGTLAPAMEVHASAREQYTTDALWFDYLERSAQSLIDIYGDARNPRPIELYDPSLAQAN